jgi:hypothetical protein
LGNDIVDTAARAVSSGFRDACRNRSFHTGGSYPHMWHEADSFDRVNFSGFLLALVAGAQFAPLRDGPGVSGYVGSMELRLRHHCD